MSTSKLIFFPADAKQIIPEKTLLSALIGIELIRENEHAENHYLLGKRFLNLVTFLGCSPNINLEPIKGETHCFVSIINTSSNIKCLGHTQTVNPKCPHCKKRIADWKRENWKNTSTLCCCDKCNKKTAYAELNWKQECGFGRCGFAVNHIYPHEAVPTDQLLDYLKKQSAFEWGYCYSNI
ncbi:hypothetical protein MNBD_GAMMA08-130 [hydrothermal vent metagenome]|uniref:Uncharacterized protein n=1 Tax=hydrothermal vent metagenome TaxID=652676 RepID=A0A3B0XKU0_9ZZZZ